MAKRTSSPPRWASSSSTEPVGLVECDECQEIVVPKGGHYSVHFATPTDTRPCPRSFPTTKTKP